jgi:hypothetical protein
MTCTVSSETDAGSDAEAGSDSDSESDSDSVPRSTSTRPGRWRLWLAPGVSRAAEPATLLLGVDAGTTHGIGPLALGLELQARWGRADLDDAEVTVRVFSAALTAAPALRLGAIELSAGPGVRVGYVQLLAHSLRTDLVGEALDGVMLGPIGVASAHLDLSGRSALRFALEGGYASRRLVGNAPGSREVLALRGLWLSATLGLSLQL